jgi:hypothetical protein
MQYALEILLAIVVLVVFVWLFTPSSGNAAQNQAPDQDKLIDPSDSMQIGVLIGLTGGSITDAAVARYALERALAQFEQSNGRKATMRDMGFVAGLMSSLK